MDKNLLFGALGNGITVFDKTVQDNGDLKKSPTFQAEEKSNITLRYMIFLGRI